MNVEMINRFDHMPRRVIQSQDDLRQINYKDFYEISWEGPNSDFGSFRVDSLKTNTAQGKRQVINVLKAAYPHASIRSFDEAVILAKLVGVKICRVRNFQYTHLT